MDRRITIINCIRKYQYSLLLLNIDKIHPLQYRQDPVDKKLIYCFWLYRLYRPLVNDRKELISDIYKSSDAKLYLLYYLT